MSHGGHGGRADDGDAYAKVFMLGAASVVFTTVSGVVADTILTSWNMRNIMILSFFQNWVLFLVGASAELLTGGGSHDSGTGVAVTSPRTDAPDARDTPPRVPWKYRLMLGMSLAGNVFFTNVASSLLTYPVQVILKSSKLIITMLMRSFVFHKPNARVDYACACMLSAGLVGFVVPANYFDAADEGSGSGISSAHGASVGSGSGVGLDVVSPEAPESGSPRFMLGLLAIAVALACESGMYILEDNVLFTRYKVSHTFIMREGYLFGGLVHIAGVIMAGHPLQFVEDLFALDPRLVCLLCIFPLILGVGVMFQLKLIQVHGSVVATACQVFRKIISVVLSMVLFSHTVGPPAMAGGLLVALSLVLKVVHKIHPIPCLVDPPGSAADFVAKAAAHTGHTHARNHAAADATESWPDEERGDGGDGGDSNNAGGTDSSDGEEPPAADQLLAMLPGVGPAAVRHREGVGQQPAWLSWFVTPLPSTFRNTRTAASRARRGEAPAEA